MQFDEQLKSQQVIHSTTMVIHSLDSLNKNRHFTVKSVQLTSLLCNGLASRAAQSIWRLAEFAFRGERLYFENSLNGRADVCLEAPDVYKTFGIH